MDWLEILAVALGLYFVVQVIRLIFADADLSLLWAAKFGKSIECLAGEIVWITGASSGIGEYLAYELARSGCKLVLSARRKDELERVKAKCIAYGKVTDSDIMILPMDVLDLGSHKVLTEKVMQHFGNIDILVNNAGRSQRALTVDTSVEVDRAMMELNALSVFSLTKSVLPHMINRKKGHIAVTSSIAGKMGSPLSSTYSATKYAVQGWFDTVRLEVAEHNITVSTLCPGPVHSNIQKEAFTAIPGQTYKEIADTNVEERRVDTDRCAYLIAVALANKFEEVWISLNPILFITYVNQFWPGLCRSIGKRIGIKVIHRMREGREGKLRKKKDK